MKNIAIYGAGGFGREVACLLHDINAQKKEWNFVGFFDDDVPVETHAKYGKILGGIDALNAVAEPLNVVFAIGKSIAVKSLFEHVKNPRIEFPNIISPNVDFLDRDSVKFGRGNVISSRSMISCDCVFGDFNLCVYGNIFGHDLRLGSFNIFNTRTTLSGNVTVGDCNFFGANFTSLQRIKIGNKNVLGASSLLTHSIPDDETYIGVPAKKFQF